MSDEALVASGKGGDDREAKAIHCRASHSPWYGNVNFSVIVLLKLGRSRGGGISTIGHCLEVNRIGQEPRWNRGTAVFPSLWVRTPLLPLCRRKEIRFERKLPVARKHFHS